MRKFDLIIIGAGSGNTIIGPDHDDWDIAIVERGPFGGTCLNVGCIPSKMLVYAAEVARLAGEVGPRLGLRTRSDGADWPAVRDRVFGRIDPIAANGASYRRDASNITVYTSQARFVGVRELDVGSEIISAERVVLAAGARPHVPTIPGLEEAGYHTSDSIMRIDELPQRLGVLGGGYIAAELGDAFAAFGSEVHFVIRGDRLLRKEDHDIARRLTELYQRKHRVWDQTVIAGAQRDGDDTVLQLRNTSDDERGRHINELRVDALLVATGRIPNSDLLQVRNCGVEIDEHGYVVTDPYLRTGVAGVWALGDITNPVQLKHVANHEARVVTHNLTAHPEDLRAVDHRFVPHAVFGHPQVAAVGLTEAQAETAGYALRVHIQPYSATAYGWAMEDTTGFVKLIADTSTRRLLGAHIIGPQASTLIQQLVQGMTFGRTVDEMARDQYYIHPALPEVLEQALLEL